MRTLAEAQLKPDVAGDVQMKQQLETEGLVVEKRQVPHTFLGGRVVF
eukprot:COSAG05_NODE_8211_length_726_cov_1.046252_2_plen_47_part_00